MTELFIAEDTGTAARALRRFTRSVGIGGREARLCPNGGSHSANTQLDIIPTPADLVNDDGQPLNGSGSTLEGAWPRDDTRWPSACACGYIFQPDDEWQYNVDRRFVAPDGSIFTVRTAPVGCMLRAYWWDFKPGAESWWVKLPDGGEWITTQEASSGGYWTVTGTPPKITVSPSIFCSPPHGWHGWIRDGKLVNA